MRRSFKGLFGYYILLFILSGCATQKPNEISYENTVALDTINVSASYETPYQPSETRFFDLIHTKLDVRFDWQKQHLLGKAELELTPWFYSTQKLVIDAKGFDIHDVALQNEEEAKDLQYSYDNAKLQIELDREYHKLDTFKIYIEYTSKPNDLIVKGGAAITADKGLYFIDPLDEDPEKPSQIWTQGETESSSCWFPTIDIPSEKMTQEIAITVADKYVTLSNGELIYQTENGDGTRTDFWSMKKPHAPYLAMMAIGSFSVIKDSWRDTVDVHYFVEPEYAPYARDIFGKTPEMMTCFSEKLGVDYPWVKYHQVVVRDYVSGAMENTSAVIHGGFVQQTSREMIDENNEDIISHELFHHWFGDLITCESWANLPLNESFATYGEYIWREYKYGRESADAHLHEMLSDYLQESEGYQEDMIRFYHDDKEDMFDGHSYSKGGRILHMLRKEVGDQAFYASLEYYLKKHAYQSVEIHDLRIAFEEITGRDLNWFFNQWFLSSGHPNLLITYAYDDSLHQQKVIITQKQKRAQTPIYKIPLSVDLYVDNQVRREYITVTEKYQEFVFSVTEKPVLVNVDAEKMLLCKKNDVKTNPEWVFQYNNAPLYMDRFEAIDALGSAARKDSLAATTVISALSDPFWKIRSLALDQVESILISYEQDIKYQLIKMAKTDKKSLVKAKAISILSSEFNDEELKSLYIDGTKDSSYAVLTESLVALSNVDNALGIKTCKTFEQEKQNDVIETICYVYSAYGDDGNHPFFEYASQNITGYTRISFINDYEYFLSGDRSYNVVKDGVNNIRKIGIDGQNRYVSVFAKQALENLKNEYKKREHALNMEISKTSDATKQKQLNTEQIALQGVILVVDKAYDDVTNHLK